MNLSVCLSVSHLSEQTIYPFIKPILMTSQDFASHMGCLNKIKFKIRPNTRMASFRGNVESSSLLRCVNLLVNKVAVLVSHVKSTHALCEHQREWLVTNLPDSQLTAHAPPNLYTIKLQKELCKHAAVLRWCITLQYTGHA